MVADEKPVVYLSYCDSEAVFIFYYGPGVFIDEEDYVANGRVYESQIIEEIGQNLHRLIHPAGESQNASICFKTTVVAASGKAVERVNDGSDFVVYYQIWPHIKIIKDPALIFGKFVFVVQDYFSDTGYQFFKLVRAVGQRWSFNNSCASGETIAEIEETGDCPRDMAE